MISRRAAQLARTFRLAAIAVAAPMATLDCTTSGDDVAGDAGAGDTSTIAPSLDATTDGAGSSSGDAGGAGDASALIDATHDSADGIGCWESLSILDGAAPDGEDLCEIVLPCGLAANGFGTSSCVVLPTVADGAVIDAASIGFPYCYIPGCDPDAGFVDDGGPITFECIACDTGGGGRKPAGWTKEAPRARDVRGAYFASMARLESASVSAFVDLARALDRHGAPAVLRDASIASARDEVRHARSMRGLARRFGAECARAPRPRRSPRAPSLARLARENAIEGCVRETYGALLAAWQADHASDPDTRAALSAIAKDELRHAALSWEIADWAATRLDARANRAIARARRRAAGKLVADASRGSSCALRMAAGLPSEREAAALARSLFDALWC